MGLSGNERAYMVALAAACRADTTRSAFYRRDAVFVDIAGVRRSGIVQASIRVDLNTGEEPHRASFDIKGGFGFIPSAGQTCTIGHGSAANPIFSGRLLKVSRSTVRNADTRPTYRCEAVGWTFDLGIAIVESAVSVTSMAPRSILGAMLGGLFTYNGVSADLPYVAEFNTGPVEPVPQAIARMFRSIDAKWYIDHDKDFHAFLTFDQTSGGLASTLTSTTEAHWGLVYNPTDLSRVYRAVQVIGAGQATLADVDTTYHDSFPLASAQGLYEESAIGEPSSLGQFVTADNVGHLVGVEGRNRFEFPPDRFQTPFSHLRVKRVSTFLPMSVNANTLTVAAENISSLSPLHDGRWYGIAGQWIYVASTVGVYSLTVSSVAYSYWVPSSISGAVESDIQPQTDIAPTWNFVPKSPRSFFTRYFPAGTQIRTRAYIEGNTAINSIAPDLGDLTDTYHWIRTIQDDRLSPSGARQVASEALARGAVSAWQALEFTTRDPYADIGRPVYVSITSLAEAGAASIVGTFAAHDITIGGFGRLTETKGPERTVRAGAVRRPTLWQVLQGDE